MTRPEEAVERARAAAAQQRAAGAYADDLRGMTVEPVEIVTLEGLLEWAVAEPDPAEVYSTRRFGAPITWVKRGLVRGMRQYLGQMLAHQARFNLQLITYVSELDDRVARLEEALERQRRGERE